MKSKMTMILMIMGLALGGFGSAFGSSEFMTPFNDANGGTSYSCNVCHTSTSGQAPRNQFGADWASGSIGNHSYAITNALASRDSDGDGITNSAEIQANTNPGVANCPPTTGDTTKPTVTNFTIPSTATDNTAVAGYLVTTSSTKPGSSDPKWSSTPPTVFTFTSTGRKRLYPWAKDAAGNVSSNYRQATVMVLGNNQEEEEEDD